jgi:HSP20 family protein
MERSFGSFYRRLPMPEGLQADQISATFTDGVLEVRAPKPTTTEPSPTKIQIT